MRKLVIVSTSVFFVFILWIIYLANTGQSSIFFKFIKLLPYGDKIGHLFLFGILAIGLNFMFKLKQIKMSIFKVYWGSFLVLIFVAIEELSQHFIPSRTLDIYDFIADVIGISIFTFLTYLLSRTTKLQQVH